MCGSEKWRCEPNPPSRRAYRLTPENHRAAGPHPVTFRSMSPDLAVAA
jgi:hypothetical protein